VRDLAVRDVTPDPEVVLRVDPLGLPPCPEPVIVREVRPGPDRLRKRLPEPRVDLEELPLAGLRVFEVLDTGEPVPVEVAEEVVRGVLDRLRVGRLPVNAAADPRVPPDLAVLVGGQRLPLVPERTAEVLDRLRDELLEIGSWFISARTASTSGRSPASSDQICLTSSASSSG
jgi:hypothetical protein